MSSRCFEGRTLSYFPRKLICHLINVFDESGEFKAEMNSEIKATEFFFPSFLTEGASAAQQTGGGGCILLMLLQTNADVQVNRGKRKRMKRGQYL